MVQDKFDGTNNIENATVFTYSVKYEFAEFTKEELQFFERDIQQFALEFNENSLYINLFVYSQYGLIESFSNDV